MNFTKGQKVKRFLTVMGITTNDRAVVLKVDKRGVWLDTGDGNDPSGPFDPNTGDGESFVPGCRTYIKAVKS